MQHSVRSLTASKPITPRVTGVPNGAAHVGEPKVLEPPHHLHVLASARLTQSRLHELPQP